LFRYHLLTLVLFSVLTGGLLGLNLQERQKGLPYYGRHGHFSVLEFHFPLQVPAPAEGFVYSQGWPMPAREFYYFRDEYHSWFRWAGLLVDVTVGAGLLSASLVGVEFACRRFVYAPRPETPSRTTGATAEEHVLAKDKTASPGQ
jgi:hypothetical protein